MNVIVTGLSSEHLTGCDMHSHPTWEIVVFLKGTGVLTVGGEKYSFRPGMIVCQPPDVPHGTRADGEYQDMYIQLQGFVPPAGGRIVFEDGEGRRFETLLRMLNEVFHQREANWRTLSDSLADAMYQLLTGWAAGRNESPIVENAVREMVLNLSNPDFEPSELAERNGYCADHFRRRFRTVTGMTPQQYMVHLRMEHARRLLGGGMGQSIRQIAMMSGYQDPYYFSRAFRKHTGMSPSEYAEHCRKERR